MVFVVIQKMIAQKQSFPQGLWIVHHRWLLRCRDELSLMCAHSHRLLNLSGHWLWKGLIELSSALLVESLNKPSPLRLDILPLIRGPAVEISPKIGVPESLNGASGKQRNFLLIQRSIHNGVVIIDENDAR